MEMFASEAQEASNNVEIIKRPGGPPGTSFPGMRHGKKNGHKEFMYSERYNERGENAEQDSEELDEFEDAHSPVRNRQQYHDNFEQMNIVRHSNDASPPRSDPKFPSPDTSNVFQSSRKIGNKPGDDPILKLNSAFQPDSFDLRSREPGGD